MPTYTFLSYGQKRTWASVPLDRFSQRLNIMAIYHLNIRHCSRNSGQSATAKFDYINRLDKYSKKQEDLQYSQSGNMPSFAKDNPELFWQSADKFERANARICTEIEFALPRELNLQQQQDLVRSFIKSTIDSEDRQLPYSFAIHTDKDNHNPHCHLVFSVRQSDGIERTAEQFFKRANSKQPELGGAKKDREIIKQEFLQSVRKTWGEQANQALEQHGHAARIDERSYKEQGVEQAPRARIDRVTWQELNRLEREERQIVQDLALKGQEITQEKAYLKQIEEKQAQGMGKYEAKFTTAFSKSSENALKRDLSNEKEKDNKTYNQEEKTAQNRIQGPSQVDFDQFLIDEWLPQIEKYVKAQEKRDEMEADITQYDKDLKRIKDEYHKLDEKKQGFLGLWETKEQKAKKKELEDKYKQTEIQRNAKRHELAEYSDKIKEYEQKTLAPINEKIAKHQADNPEIKMRSLDFVRKIKVQGAFKAAQERMEREQQRQQAKQQRSLERGRGFSL